VKQGLNKAVTNPVNKAEYATNFAFNPKLWRSVPEGQHRYLLVVNQELNQNQVVDVDAASPKDAVKWCYEQGYVPKEPARERQENHSQWMKRNTENKKKGENFLPYEVPVRVYSKNSNAYVDAPNKEEAVKHARGQGYHVVYVRDIVDQSQAGARYQPQQAQQPQQPQQKSTSSAPNKNRWMVTGRGKNGEQLNNVKYTADADKTEKDVRDEFARRGYQIFSLEVFDKQNRKWVSQNQYHQPVQTAPVNRTKNYFNQNQKAASLEQYADLIRDTLGMSRTADLVRQAAQVITAVQEEVQTDGDLDEVVTTAIKQASQDILKASDRLRQTTHVTAHRIAYQIEQDFVDSLSFRIGA
jgi:hypothetical protein